MTLHVLHARTCTVSGQSAPFAPQGRPRTVACVHGTGRLGVHVAANYYSTRAPIHFQITAHGAGNKTAWEQIAITEAGETIPTAGSPPPTSTTPGSSAPLSIDQTSLPDGTAGIAYDTTLTASGGVAPYSWAITSGTLPAGLTLNTDGEISGIPTTPGPVAVTVTVSDANADSASQSYSLTIAAAAPPTAESPNWSGYVIPSSDAIFTEVGGSWTVPTLNCAATPNGGAAIWVGIGGQTWPTGGSSGTLLQTGVTTDCVNGAQQNDGWVEEYPSEPNESVAFAGFPVAPGDAISATVYQGATGAWETRVDDLTTELSGVMVTGEGWGVMPDAGNGTFALQGSTADLTYDGGYSAEWIVEDYGVGPDASLVPLADFGTVTFSNLTTSLPAGWTLTPDEAVAIAQGSTVLSTPSPPDGTGFSVSYTG